MILNRTRSANPTAIPGGLIAALMLGAFALLAALSIRDKSPTFDEGIYVTVGYSYWVTGDMRLNLEHPPLAKRLVALPLLAQDLKFSTDWPEWQQARQRAIQDRFLYQDNAGDHLVFQGRLVAIGIAALLGLLVWMWTRDLAGEGAAHLALLLLLTTPPFIAHAQLATTDIALTTFFFGSIYFFHQAITTNRTASEVLSGLFLGAAFASKFSGVIALPIMVVLLGTRLLRRSDPSDPAESPVRATIQLARVTLLALGVVWLSYGTFPGSGQGSAGLHALVEAAEPSLIGSLGYTLAGWALPTEYVQGLLMQLEHRAHPAFLDGEHSLTGWIRYFPLTAAYKMPIPALLLILAGGTYAAARIWRGSNVHRFLLIPPVLFLAVAMLSPLNIGHRYILPLYPFLFVLAGEIAGVWLRSRAAARMGVVALLIWQIAGTTRAYPHYLAWFNEIAGGPENGWKHLVDSDLDWGQELPALKRWMDTHGETEIYLSYFGTARPEHYGIDYQSLPSFLPLSKPQSGRPTSGDLVAIGATNLQAVYFGSRPDFSGWLRHLRDSSEPEAILGHSLFLYRLP